MKVALVWNGDRSSALAYSNVKQKFVISFLITFLVKGKSDLRVLSILKRQSENRGVPFFWAKIKTGHAEEYRETITELKKDYGIEGIVTNGNERLIENACDATGMKVIIA